MKAPTVNNLWDVLLLAIVENFRVDAQCQTRPSSLSIDHTIH